MKRKQLFVPLALIAGCLVGTTSAGAAVISFIEDPADTASIVVNTDIMGATIAAGVEFASLSVGNVTGASTLLFRRQMINMGSMTGEGGGSRVSDVLELDSFLSAAGGHGRISGDVPVRLRDGYIASPGKLPCGCDQFG